MSLSTIENEKDNEPGVSTLGGAFTSSFPKITPEQTCSVYLSFLSNSGQPPRLREPIDLR